MKAVKATNLAVIKGKQPIIDGLTFAIKPGTITGLIGPSGSGKTTLMRSIVGVQKYQGELVVLGLAAGSRQLRPKIGYVTQSPAIYGDLTVRQNIAYFATIAGASSQQVDEIIDTVDLTAQTKQLTGSLSGGQKARVSLAIALLGEPEILVLDEPTVGLDPILRNNLWGLFAELASSGKTLLVSSHVMDEAERCDQLILMRGGRLLWHGEKAALLRRSQARDVATAFVRIIEEAA